MRSKRIPYDASRIDLAGLTGKVNFVVFSLIPLSPAKGVKTD